MSKFIVSQRLAKLGVGFPVFIAPMVGISNLPFRKLIRSYTPSYLKPFLFTEMLSSRRLSSSKLNMVGETRFQPEHDSPLIVQLLGNEERHIAESIKRLQVARIWGIDINMGCPVARTLRYNWGIQLMSDPQYAAQVVAMTRKNCPQKLSVKLRVSHKDSIDLQHLENLTKALEDSGADWLSIHSRTKAEKHSGKGHWDTVGHIATKRNIPVVLNGNIQNASHVLKAFQEIPIDGVMIGRAAVVRPWILWQCAEALGYPVESPAPRGPAEEGQEFLSAVLRLVDFYKEDITNEKHAVEQIQFFLGHANRWLDFGHEVWKKSLKAQNLDNLKDTFTDFKNHIQLKMQESLTYH